MQIMITAKSCDVEGAELKATSVKRSGQFRTQT